MASESVWVTAVLVAIAVGVIGTLLVQRRAQFSHPVGLIGVEDVEPDPVANARDLEPAVSDEVLVLPGSRPNELFVFGSLENVREMGREVSLAPVQLAKHATRLKASVDGVVAYQEMVGRLVVVDEKTAAAVRAARAAKDGSGEILGLIRGAKGRWEHVARLRSVGTLASLSSLSNAAHAMAVQAQMERIEKQLGELRASVGEMHRDLIEQWDAEAQAALTLLASTYRAALDSGTLSETNWGRVEAAGITILKHLIDGRTKLERVVTELEDLGSKRGLKNREKSIERLTRSLFARHAAMLDSARAWVQYESLTIWRMAVADDPTQAAQRRELASFLDENARVLGIYEERTDAALRQLGQYKVLSSIRHPVSRKRLPRLVDAAQVRLAATDWTPLQLRPAVAQIEAATAISEGSLQQTRGRFLEDLRVLLNARSTDRQVESGDVELAVHT